MATKIKITGPDALAIRKKLSLNQSDFWTPFGVTQSGGSRYESGRNIPRPVQILLAAKYGKAAAKREALAVVGVEAGPDDNKGAQLLAPVRKLTDETINSVHGRDGDKYAFARAIERYLSGEDE